MARATRCRAATRLQLLLISLVLPILWAYDRRRSFHFRSQIQETSMRIFSATLLALCFAASLAAQDTRGAISGTVTDPQGAIMTGAAVTVTNTETNISVALATN